MSRITQAGITPHELDGLVDGDRWRLWRHAEPALVEFGSLGAIRQARGETEDRALGALLRLADARGYDDQLAAVAVLHQLGGSVRTIARHFWHLSDGDIESIVVGAVWEQIRCYAQHARRCHHASVIHHNARKSVRAILLPDTSRTRGRRVVLLSPQSWVFEAVAEQPPESLPLDNFDSREQLEIFLRWASGHGVVEHDDLALLSGLLDLDRRNAEIPKWLRGACSTAAVERMASERGVCAKSIYRARDRVLTKLRDAAPLFLDEVA
ncbi:MULTISPECIES: hypothetical protein [unclassified Nocardioides]|uniref:hypothetical protein n=1 Tax=unclassified Nocardioides TaxID=2615069 RepID=UPI00070130B7|nr:MULTISPECIES: hypothetical protein [unclassified Nocardioides]KRA37938.1 hypothetical protein ASD81_04440 [Nocardioides sp. Root614]KRA91898.1 hypothetical protein ASD84_04705 [Nocardioides sp. Root682]